MRPEGPRRKYCGAGPSIVESAAATPFSSHCLQPTDSSTADLHNGIQKRNGRKITTMNDIFSRKSHMPKIKITANELGQPVGENYRRFASAIGCQVRKTLPVRYTDWRAVPIGMKIQVWTGLQEYFDMDESVRKWFIDTAAKKWKDYKTHLKEKFFDETLTDEQMEERLKNILNVEDISGLIKFWRSPECQARSERGKANRAKLRVHHTSGSISYACRSYNMGKALGRPPRRDEVYINTHTRKNGVPSREAAGTIDELKAIIEAQPELKDRTIQEGDAFATVCGAKETRGRVRVLGLGPTPQEIGTPGLKGLMSTRMQFEIWERQKAESRNKFLEQRIREMEEERIEQGRTNIDVLSHHGSNSRQYATTTPEGPTNEAHNAPRLEEYDNYIEDEDYDQYDEDENLTPHRHAAA